MNNTEKVFIILGFFVILIYFIHYFSLDSTIINLLGLSKESFQNHFFEPNQIFRHKNKIYLLASGFSILLNVYFLDNTDIGVLFLANFLNSFIKLSTSIL